MPFGLNVTVAVTLWLILGIPLWLYTVAVRRSVLNYDLMNYYASEIDSLITPKIGPIYVDGHQWVPDMVPTLNRIEDLKFKDSEPSISSPKIQFEEGTCLERGTDVCVFLDQSDEDAIGLPPSGLNAAVRFSERTLASGGVPAEVLQLVRDHLLPRPEVDSDRKSLVTPYSPQYHLTFSLLAEGGGPYNWNIDEALQKLQPLLHQLNSTVANFTVDSQIEYFAKPGCAVPDSRELSNDDLTTFVNSAEWRLASSMPYPTLNFLLYVPSEPLNIARSSTNSFVVPRWGGVIIAPSTDDTVIDANNFVELFAGQLLALLGTPDSPSSLELRLRELSRQTTYKALKATAASLGSLSRLALSMPHIAIPQDVQKKSYSALSNLIAGLDAVRDGDEVTAIAAAGSAFVDAEEAFFDKHMVSQVYFPEDHRLAVYMPFIGPILVVISTGWYRIFNEWKTRRKAVKAAQKN